MTLDDRDEAVLLFGSRDQYLRMIRDALGVRLIARGDTIQIEGTEEQVSQAERVFQQLRQMLRKQGKLIARRRAHGARGRPARRRDRQGRQPVTCLDGSRHVRPRTDGQARYVRAMRDNDLTLCIGPAGTGKTYLAVGHGGQPAAPRHR